jgi:hypothetical protein
MRPLLSLLLFVLSHVTTSAQTIYVVRGQFSGFANAYSKWTFVSEELIQPPFSALNVIETRYGSGIGGEFALGYMHGTNLQLSLAYAGYEADDKTHGGRLKHSMVTVNGAYYLTESSLRPFGQVGIGLTHLRMSYLLPSSVSMENADRWMPIVTLGGGADVFLTEETIFNIQLAAHVPLASRRFQLSKGSNFRAAWLGSAQNNFGTYRLQESLVFFTLSGGVVFRIGF